MAKKPYDGYTRQTKAIKNASLTLSTYPTVKWLPNNSYEYMKDDSFVKLNLYEKEKGLNVYFNLNITNLRNLHKEIQARYICPGMPYSRNFTKVYGNYPKNESEYRQACQTASVNFTPLGRDLCSDCRKLQITYNPVMPDGSAANNPWMIKIQNGMAKVKRGKVAGSFYEAGGSFACLAENSIRLTQELMDDLISCQVEFFDDLLTRAKNGELPGVDGIVKRMATIEEYTKRSDYYDQETPQYVGYTQPPMQANAPVQQPMQNQQPMQQAVANPGNPTVQMIQFETVISSEFALEGTEWKAQGLCNGKIYTLYFACAPGTQDIPEELIRSQQTQTPVLVAGWQDDNDRIHCSLVK